MHEREIKALQDMVSTAIRRCRPTDRYRTSLVLAMIGLALTAKTARSNPHEHYSYARRKKTLVAAVRRLYQDARTPSTQHQQPKHQIAV